MASVPLGTAKYVGIDILEPLVQRNRARYENASRSFISLNLIEDQLPEADLVLCRDCLGHIPTVDVFRALQNFASSGARYLLATTFTGRSTNADIAMGEWRPLNLQAAPFFLPAPLQIIKENCTEAGGSFRDKSLGLWRLADLRLPAR
jgi:hypothetical protein